MPSASHPATSPADGAPRGMVKAHQMALCPNDWQASLMAEHAGWSRVASNWSLGRFAEAWFTGEGRKNEWFSNVGTIYLVANPVSPRRTEVYYWPITNREVANWARLNEPVEGVLEIRRRGRLVASIEATDYVDQYPEGRDLSDAVVYLARMPIGSGATSRPADASSGIGCRPTTTTWSPTSRIWTTGLKPEPWKGSRSRSSIPVRKSTAAFPLNCRSATASFRSAPLKGRFSPGHAHG